ncbi:hypothetical protein niasHT_039583 [Heterodera trifolii]|uniref:Uncharacterized protein n=1 Tax=Heterodera trifolii TaxID=157864 RepID=A0ABD2IGP3_9BILA
MQVSLYDGGIGPPKPKSPATIAAGQEESNKVALLTCATAFPADKRWTHVAGVQHVICRSGDDSQIYGIGKNTTTRWASTRGSKRLAPETWCHSQQHKSLSQYQISGLQASLSQYRISGLQAILMTKT